MIQHPSASSSPHASAPRGTSARRVALLLGAFALLTLCGCVNQSIAARRSDIPWNRPDRGEATAHLPFSITEQYED